ncbi:MAG: hypothetical protein L0Y76_02830 [Ignavibacteria bacterium]|nr:hypothetical protein [Ignavibacteria bacterium]
MVSVLLISIPTGVTINILESFGIYKKGSPSCGETDYITGSGYQRRGRVYTYVNGDCSATFESAKVFGFLILIFAPFTVLISVIIHSLN